MSFSFLTNKQAAEKIAGLESRIAELEADGIARDAELATARAEVAAHAESIASLTDERDSAIATLGEANAALETATAEVAAAQEKVATFDAELEAAVINRVASLGFNEKLPEAKTEAADSKPDLSALTGIAKTVAAFEARKK
jgi:chromosome segregation ATPase